MNMGGCVRSGYIYVDITIRTDSNGVVAIKRGEGEFILLSFICYSCEIYSLTFNFSQIIQKKLKSLAMLKIKYVAKIGQVFVQYVIPR
jgi:hypothetical protein